MQPPFDVLHDKHIVGGNWPAEAAWEHPGIGFCLINQTGNILRANDEFARLVGVGSHELVGANFLQFLTPETAVQAAAAHQAFLQGDAHALGNVKYIQRDGRPLFVHVLDSKVALSDGAPARLTALVNLESAAENDDRLGRLRQAEVFSSLASTIGNDLNNLLSIIMGHTGLLQELLHGSDLGTVGLQGIEQAVQRAADMVRQALYLARRGAGNLQPIYLWLLLEEFLAKRSESSALPVKVTIDRSAPAIMADPDQLTHAVQEIARKCQQTLGSGWSLRLVMVRVRGSDLREEFPEVAATEYLQLVIMLEPPARGLSEVQRAESEAFFSRFHDRRRDLTYLLLQSIMATHRGLLGTSGQGSGGLALRMYFPVAAASVQPAAVPTPPRPRPEALGAERDSILIVDDEEHLHQTLGVALASRGFRLLAASDGLLAIDTVTREGPRLRLILLDLGLPRMSGWEAYLQIRSLQPNVPVIFMSGHLEGHLETDVLRSGARGFLAKPFRVGEAMDLVLTHAGPPPAK